MMKKLLVFLALTVWIALVSRITILSFAPDHITQYRAIHDCALIANERGLLDQNSSYVELFSQYSNYGYPYEVMIFPLTGSISVPYPQRLFDDLISPMNTTSWISCFFNRDGQFEFLLPADASQQ
jgi:hypothetical protein